MNQDQRAAFEARYMSDMFLCAPVDTIVFATDDNGYYLDSRVQAAWRGYKAALESQEVQGLYEALEVARNGIAWYIENTNYANGCDDEALEKIDAALAAMGNQK